METQETIITEKFKRMWQARMAKKHTQEIIQQEMERQQHRRELRNFRWTEIIRPLAEQIKRIIRPLAEQIKRELIADRPFLKDDKAWELAKERAWAQYNSERKAKRLGITFK